jgi:hypothetical protein
MRRIVCIAIFILLSFAPASAESPGQATDAQIRAHLMRQSLAGYPGSCPCPDSLDRAGRRCGNRSAYSRPGGYAPLCSPSDVTTEMIAEFRKAFQ